MQLPSYCRSRSISFDVKKINHAMVNSEVQRNGLNATNRPEPVEIVLDDESDEEMPDITQEVATSSNGLELKESLSPKPQNGSCAETPQLSEMVIDEEPRERKSSTTSSANGVGLTAHNLPELEPKKTVMCIDLVDDDVVVEEPPAKRLKSETPAESSSRKESPAPVVKKEAPQLTNYDMLLDYLHEYIETALLLNDTVERKLLDTLLGAINVQVQKEPRSVQKLILEKQLVLPNSISFPPSQVVDLVIEHDADVQITRVINRIFGEDRQKLTDVERRERQQLKTNCSTPAMTRMLMEIGQDLVQEATYSDIVHARNLPEMPKNVDTYKMVAAQLKPVWQTLRDKNTSFKLKQHCCSICGYKTDNLVQYSIHKQTLHFDSKNSTIQCGMCPEFNTNGTRIQTHYLEEHQLVPLTPEDPPAKIQCSICDEDFQYKGQRDNHFKQCKRDTQRVNGLQASRMPEHSSVINRWLWPRPPPDPKIHNDVTKVQQRQQQQQQAQQREKERLAARTASNSQQSTPLTSAALAAALKNHQQSGTGGMTVAAALMAQTQLHNQFKNLNPLQRQQLETLLRTNQPTLPVSVIQTLQNHLQKHKSNNANANPKAVLQQLAQHINPQVLAQLQQALQQQNAQQSSTAARRNTTITAALAAAQAANQNQPQRKVGGVLPSSSSTGRSNSNARGMSMSEVMTCEICDEKYPNKREYISHLQTQHLQFRNKASIDLEAGPPLACSRCRERFWSYDGLERHLVMEHYLVTSDLLAKAQKKTDGGRCKLCKKSFAFNMLQHLASDHSARLCSAEIMFSCDVCPFRCSSYQKLEEHLNVSHPKNGTTR
ncbi:Mep-1 [Aphelenchoides besseyi]|nr:Mep-1 [Aphelenchoides besseyi]